MKKTITNIILLASSVAGVAAPVSALPGVTVSDLKMEQSGDYLSVGMKLGLDGLDVPSNRAVLITPRLINGADTLSLPAVGVYGRTRYYYYQRNNGDAMISGTAEQSFKASQAPSVIEYSEVIPYAEWMNGAVLRLYRDEYGCCRNLMASADEALGRHIGSWFPELVYVMPQAKAQKTREIHGSAYVEFPVNVSKILPDYRTNSAELGKILASIDTVKNDRDASVTSVWLKGFASPEGPWDNNVRLARERTASVKEYVDRLYNFPAGVMTTEFDPEDWAGLRRYVESSNLEHKDRILADIDLDMAPDAKEWRIKSTYPEEYRFLLENVYPGLRHTDYRISYTLRHYSDVNEIRRVLQERPQNLDLDELYLLAAEYEPGTPEFTEVYETAVRMFPSDPLANLNAANAAMRRGDNEAAARYLTKAGDSAEAVYSRAALEIRNNNFQAALPLLRKAQSMGLKQAGATLQQVEKLLEN